MLAWVENGPPWGNEVTLIKAIIFGDEHMCVCKREKKTERQKIFKSLRQRKKRGEGRKGKDRGKEGRIGEKRQREVSSNSPGTPLMVNL